MRERTLDQWIVSARPPREQLDPFRPYAFMLEDERSASGEVVPVATIFLTNRECPWRCLMCDLWRNTLTESVTTGAIPQQIDYALARLPTAKHLKLYNAGSFFDSNAIPLEDYPAIAQRAKHFERVIVESHPSLVGERCLAFRRLLNAPLEVAMGLETVHPAILPRLNKRMRLPQFAAAAELLRRHSIALRSFVLVQPPFMAEQDSVEWATRSLDFAFDCGSTAVTLIPTRAGNGVMDQLALAGDFAPPSLATLESCLEYGINLHRGRVFLDLWDAHPGHKCPRVTRLASMNLSQTVLPGVSCAACEAV
jgi:radical SAM enzyme (TIGR01210 family)